MANEDPIERRRARDRARSRRRAGERAAAGLCVRCGRRAPEAGRTACAECAERKRAASRARDARLRAEGKPRRRRREPRETVRERRRRQTAGRIARGVCTRCGIDPPEAGRRQCGPCLARDREADRLRYEKARALGLTYGGRDPDRKRAGARAANRKRREDRRAEGRCTRCGRRPPAENGTVCETCRVERRAVERAIYEARRSAGLCGRCGGPTTDGGSRCAPCGILEAERGNRDRKNRQARERYSRRRARDKCTDCGGPAHGACRCPACATRSHERSGRFRGMPLYPPSYTVIELASGACHGTYDSMADVALCLAFAKLSRDEVEVIVDGPEIARYAAWE